MTDFDIINEIPSYLYDLMVYLKEILIYKISLKEIDY